MLGAAFSLLILPFYRMQVGTDRAAVSKRAIGRTRIAAHVVPFSSGKSPSAQWERSSMREGASDDQAPTMNGSRALPRDMRTR